METCRQTFSETEDFHLEWEVLDGECHIHCTVSKEAFNKTLLRQGYREFVKLKRFIKGMGYDCFYSVSPNPKFCLLFGAKSLGTYKEFEVMRWENH